eukprot:TRINITY_DN1579_c0_g1_i2.p1 TRINITY_DN1579_c0_g1~~TRINITY_DN1579_c0_g1_i2.p1  ORF type:complete len:463 (-),score=137.68 TRINITY_DN1579_c0_g1_i2:1058-2446(-)
MAEGAKERIAIWRLLGLSMFSFGVSFIGIALVMIVLPEHVIDMVGKSSKGTAMGVVMFSGGVIGFFMPPIIGRLSDRAQCRIGRRKPFIISGILIAGCFLLVLGFIDNIFIYVPLYAVYMFGNVTAFSGYTPMIADNVPHSQLGLTSSFFGGAGLIGVVLGSSFGLAAKNWSNVASYTMISIMFISTGMISTMSIKEKSTDPRDRTLDDKDSKTEPLLPADDYIQNDIHKIEDDETSRHKFFSLAESDESLKDIARTLIKPLKNNDFRYVVVSRLLFQAAMLQLQIVLEYYFKDVIDPHMKAKKAVSMWTMTMMIGALFPTFLMGGISDKTGNKKLYAQFSGYIMALSMWAFPLMPTFHTNLITAIPYGVSYGTYAVIDYALALSVLPSAEAVGADLGIWQMTMTLPSMFGPVFGGMLDGLNKIGKDTDGLSSNLGYYVIFVLIGLLFFVSGLFLRNVKTKK